jgi:sec-independent protein translocase protein TatC
MEIYKSCALQEWKEKCKGIHLFSSLLFFIGVLFGYYIVIPMSVNFVATFKVSDLVLNQFTLDSYIGLVKRPFWQVDYFLNYQLLSISWQNWD